MRSQTLERHTRLDGRWGRRKAKRPDALKDSGHEKRTKGVGRDTRPERGFEGCFGVVAGCMWK